MILKLILSGFVALSAVVARTEAKVTTVMDLSLLGGQYFLDDSAASFEGKADAFISPVVNISENHELIPIYSGYYNGTQDVQELAGGGVLTRQRQSHNFSLKYVYTRDFDKFKPRISYSKAYVQETNDEKWGSGLFDYNTFSAGFEAEQERPRGTFTESYDFYAVKYPNYSTLLSNSETVIDTTTFSELSQNAGVNTMDNVNHRLSFGYTWFPEPLTLSSSYEITYRKYGDQAVVSRPLTGTPYFKSDKRTDYIQTLNFRASRALKPVNLYAAARITRLDSNQNSYDSSRTKFIGDYYSYMEMGVSPGVSLRAKNGAYFSFSVDWSRLYYLGRLAQDAAGNYSSAEINQTLWLSSLSARYPLSGRFFLKGVYSYRISSSNMKYEACYRYNYRASAYLMGVEWEF